MLEENKICRQPIALILFLSFAVSLAGCLETVTFATGQISGPTAVPDEKGGTIISAHFAKPDGPGPFPAVVLLHACGGVQTHVLEGWPNFLTKNGFATLTVDTVGSRGVNKCYELESRNLDMSQDAYGALDFLANRREIDGKRIGVMGFSYGANVVNHAATGNYLSAQNRNFVAGVAMYGKCYVYSKPAFPIIEIIGDLDKNVDNCFLNNYDNLSVEVIKGARHAFDQPQISEIRRVTGGHDAIYSHEATEKAKQLVINFFGSHLK